MPPTDPAAPSPPSPDGASDTGDPRDRRIAQLQVELDDVSQQLLQARDAVVGAEAERASALARVVEVEHHLHVRTAEVDELRRAIEELIAAADHEPAGPNPVTRRLSPLLARSARLGQ